jgi:hypothetical protein
MRWVAVLFFILAATTGVPQDNPADCIALKDQGRFVAPTWPDDVYTYGSALGADKIRGIVSAALNHAPLTLKTLGAESTTIDARDSFREALACKVAHTMAPRGTTTTDLEALLLPRLTRFVVNAVLVADYQRRFDGKYPASMNLMYAYSGSLKEDFRYLQGKLSGPTVFAVLETASLRSSNVSCNQIPCPAPPTCCKDCSKPKDTQPSCPSK